MENKRYLPTWASLLIGLIAISTINVLWKRYNQHSDKWHSLQMVTNQAGVNLLPDTAERRKWCDCVIQTFKNKYPDGIDNIGQDSLNADITTISYNCIHAIRNQKSN